MPAGGASTWFGAFIGALAAGMGHIISAIPNLLGALIILLIGWGIGKLIQAVVTRVLNAVHFNDVTERAGINSVLSRADISARPSTILGVLAYWFVFLFAVNAAVSALGIPALSALISAVILYLPKVFAALLVIVAGAWIANALGRLTTTSATTAGISFAPVLGNIVLWSVLFFTFAIALNVLGLPFPFLTIAFAVIVGGMALAAALAFGLGGREYASDVLAGRELRTLFNTGDHFVAEDLEGMINSMRPTVTIVSTARGDIAVQNSELMRKHATKPSPASGGGSMNRAA